MQCLGLKATKTELQSAIDVPLAPGTINFLEFLFCLFRKLKGPFKMPIEEPTKETVRSRGPNFALARHGRDVRHLALGRDFFSVRKTRCTPVGPLRHAVWLHHVSFAKPFAYRSPTRCQRYPTCLVVLLPLLHYDGLAQTGASRVTYEQLWR